MKEQSKLFVKGMVCNRCITTVDNELKSLGYMTESITLGEVNLQPGSKIDLNTITKKLEQHGFSLVEDRNAKVIKEVKQLVEEVYSGDYDFPEKFRFADLVQKRFNKSYEVVRDTFIALEKISVERYIIDFRIGKIKEFLVYTNLTLSDIAFRLTLVARLICLPNLKTLLVLPHPFSKRLNDKRQG